MCSLYKEVVPSVEYCLSYFYLSQFGPFLSHISRVADSYFKLTTQMCQTLFSPDTFMYNVCVHTRTYGYVHIDMLYICICVFIYIYMRTPACVCVLCVCTESERERSLCKDM